MCSIHFMLDVFMWFTGSQDEAWCRMYGQSLPQARGVNIEMQPTFLIHLSLYLIYSSCVHLLAEFSKVAGCDEAVTSLLPVLADTTRYKQYRHHYNLLETLFEQHSLDTFTSVATCMLLCT